MKRIILLFCLLFTNSVFADKWICTIEENPKLSTDDPGPTILTITIENGVVEGREKESVIFKASVPEYPSTEDIEWARKFLDEMDDDLVTHEVIKATEIQIASEWISWNWQRGNLGGWGSIRKSDNNLFTGRYTVDSENFYKGYGTCERE